ncbi:hypothetical protein KSP40_PGU008298 [Platanthera guangdongensis]|uniref:leucine--tRNA ligase n=1 Tax=Platanthera guangdongensis TaxID=2320717 RepID=A0ABR2LV72_9ASPA
MVSFGHFDSLAYEQFPEPQSEYLRESKIVLPVQINGRTRATIMVDEECSEAEVFGLASANEKLSRHLFGKTIKKLIYVPRRILNVILETQKASSWYLMRCIQMFSNPVLLVWRTWS